MACTARTSRLADYGSERRRGRPSSKRVHVFPGPCGLSVARDRARQSRSTKYKTVHGSRIPGLWAPTPTRMSLTELGVRGRVRYGPDREASIDLDRLFPDTEPGASFTLVVRL